MIASALLLVAAPVTYELEAGEKLVMVGQDGTDLDACGAMGRVRGLKRGGDNFLSVRIAPAIEARERDQLGNGNRVFLCDQSGDWYGVVYQRAGDSLQDCGTDSPSTFVGAYRGPCRYGWVHKYFVEILAG